MKKLIQSAAIVAAFGACGVAAGQTPQALESLYPHGITVRGGIALPFESRLSNDANLFANLGVEVGMRSLFREGESYIALDHFFRAFGGSGNSSATPLTVNHRFYGDYEDLRRSYFFVGLGVSFIHADGNGTALTVRGGVGQEFSDRVIGEIAVYLSDRAAGTRANALTFNVGYRF